jgi:hypothetical protein
MNQLLPLVDIPEDFSIHRTTAKYLKAKINIDKTYITTHENIVPYILVRFST